jgi:hypothetical protein
VGLVDDDDIVFGQHVRFPEGVDGQQGMVRHDDIGFGGLVPGDFGEAFGEQRAVRTEAVEGVDGHL